MTPHRGTLILVLGVLGLILCMPLGIVAWVMGSGDLKEMDAGTMDAGGRSMTQAGKIFGIITVVFFAVAFIAGLMVALVVGFAHRH
jgi:hypothetical protein